MTRPIAATWLVLVASLNAWGEGRPALPESIQRGLGFEDEGQWTGGELVTEPRHSGESALRWANHSVNGSVVWEKCPRDLSAFNVLSFWLHSSHANNDTFMVIVESQRQEGVFSYYMRKVTVNWTGWKQLRFHYRSFGKAREPAGWDKITRFRFSATGWDQSPNDESVWVLDDLQFTYTDEPYRPEIKVQKYVTEPKPEAFLAKLRPNHPRLILLDEDLPRLKQFVTTDPRGKAWYENARRRAESLYAKPVRKHELPDGRRLLSISRDVLDRMYHWGFFYRMEGDRKWLDRAWKELDAVVHFPDWNPNHYLDTAEMMHAVGLGYDWFYNDLTESQRSTLREGLWRLGLRLSYAAYLGLDAEGMQGWRSVTNNWNFVCNGGTSLAAMAVLDDDPKRCTQVLHAAFQYIQIPLKHFEPDGAWWEGIGYWGYSMRYLLAYLRGLETAFGTDFGFIDALNGKGFSKAGDFPVYLVSPLGGIYNFADSGSGGGTFQHFGLFYLADKYRNPLYQHFQEEHTGGTVQDLLYYRPFKADLAVQEVALDKYFRETEVATMRSSWTDRNALFVGIKAGANGIAHAHQDLGSFAFYGLGEKWCLDLGTEGQTYQSHKHHLPRSYFYRIRAEGHNTLVFNPNEKYCQDAKGKAKITRFESSPEEAFGIADLSHPYRQYADSVRRGYRLFDQRRAFLVQDEITGAKDAEVWWFSHGSAGTEYVVTEAGRTVHLRRNGKTCRVVLLSPPGAKFQVLPAAPLPTSPNPDIQNPNKGMQKLGIHLTGITDATIAVLFAPTDDREALPLPKVEVTPLAEWKLPAGALPQLASLTIDGAPLPDFTPHVYTYAIPLSAETSRVPSVVATSGGGEVTVTPAKAFPGTGRVSVSSGNRTATYLVRFIPERLPGGTDQLQRKSKPETVNGIVVSASHDDGNVPKNVLDGDLTTRWSANGAAEWIAFDLGKPRQLKSIAIAWYTGDQRQTKFEVSVSDEGKQWREVFAGQSSGKTAASERYAFRRPVTARHVRITGHGNTLNLWNSITEVSF